MLIPESTASPTTDPGQESVQMDLTGWSNSGWCVTRHWHPRSPASVNTEVEGSRATRSRATADWGFPTWRPQLSHDSAKRKGAHESTHPRISFTRTMLSAPRQSKRGAPPGAPLLLYLFLYRPCPPCVAVQEVFLPPRNPPNKESPICLMTRLASCHSDLPMVGPPGLEPGTCRL